MNVVTTMTKRLVVLLSLAIGMTVAAAAADLHTYRAQGVIGEKPDGYVALVAPNAPPDAQAVVQQVNAARRAEYAKIAQQTGTTVEAVGAITARKQIQSLPSGSFFMDGSGRWVRKP